MIHHVSIPAHAPREAAKALAELMGGKCYPFPGPVPGAFMAVSGDQHGTMIEVYPEDAVFRPGEGAGDVVASTGKPIGEHAFHLLLSVPVDEATVQRIGARMGWRTQRCGRGPKATGEVLFEVIELWLDNRLMIEVATPDMVSAYTDLFRFDRLDAFFQRMASMARAA
jgi:hypothetical protein